MIRLNTYYPTTYIYVYIFLEICFLHSGFPIKILYAFRLSAMRATFPAHLTLHDFIILIILGQEYKLRRSSSCSFLNLLSLHPSLDQIFLLTTSHHDRPLMSDTKLLTHTEPRANYSFIYSKLHISREETKRQKVLERLVASIAQIQCPLNFLLNQSSICYRPSQIYELFRIWKGSVTYPHVITLPCILVMRQQHILASRCAYL
jgi:hypothetical protein